MANGKEHILFSAGLGVAGYALYCACFQREFKIGEALLDMGTCVLGSLVPDGLEPALHPCHRSTAHSVGAGALSVRC
jgi:hypothetical protein